MFFFFFLFFSSTFESPWRLFAYVALLSPDGRRASAFLEDRRWTGGSGREGDGGGKVRRLLCLCRRERASVAVRVCVRLLPGGGRRWDLPLSVIEKCDLENVCPAEHESYLHGDGAALRGGSPGP